MASKLRILNESLKSVVVSYQHHLREKNPFKTKMLTSFLLYSLGDAACQLRECKQNP